MRQLPTGTVTFLFTDIEGSTRLLEEQGERYAELLERHHAALEQAIADNGGSVVDTQGDAFFAAFADPAAALASAEQAQQALEVPVRMGIHTGEPNRTARGYIGIDVHRAARTAASAHGGQIVLSAASAALLDRDLTELGEHRLKDFDEPIALFQLGSERFPPLRTISNTNLPRPASSFVGREREVGELVSMLSNGARLVTLSGPGGSGKTRLALEAASELVPAFKAGVFWVGLAALRDPALVTETIAQTLGAKDGVAGHIEDRELLLLLDNLEQVVEAAVELGELLEACPNLKLLVTSRELLRVKGEVEYPVPPLAESDAVELFCARSRLEPDDTIAELCRRLDDLPLALELAAARTSVLSPAQILERLSQRLDLLKGGRDTDPRQQTLRATIEWSHDLLDEDEQRLFARLAVFRGGCTLEAAEQVAEADLDTLQSLVDKSLLRHTDERFWMLETIREYARERLATGGEQAELCQLHADWCLGFAEERIPELVEGGGDAVVFAGVEAERDNLRAALDWSRDSREDEVLMRLVASTAFYWSTRGLNDELDVWIARALERGRSPARARMEVLRYACIRADMKSDWTGADALTAEWLSVAEEEEDEPQVLAAMNSAALNAAGKGDFDDARAQLVALEERASRAGEERIVALATLNLGHLAVLGDDLRAGLDYSRKAAELLREPGDDAARLAAALGNCGWSSLGLGDPERGAEYLLEALALVAPIGVIRTRSVCRNVSGLAAALVAMHQEERGAQLLGAAASLRDELKIGLEDELEEQTNERAVAAAKASLGDEAFAAAWARGQAMTPEETLAFCATPTGTSDG